MDSTNMKPFPHVATSWSDRIGECVRAAVRIHSFVGGSDSERPISLARVTDLHRSTHGTARRKTNGLHPKSTTHETYWALASGGKLLFSPCAEAALQSWREEDGSSTAYRVTLLDVLAGSDVAVVVDRHHGDGQRLYRGELPLAYRELPPGLRDAEPLVRIRYAAALDALAVAWYPWFMGVSSEAA